jgi:hypothetical protein
MERQYMEFLNNLRRKYVFLIPVVFLLINAFYNIYVIQAIKDVLLEEKFIETVNSVDMLGAAVYANNGRFWEDNEQNIIDSINFLDNLPMVFAAAYKPVDGAYRLITEREETTNFDPMLYGEFTREIKTQLRGDVVVGFMPEDGNNRDVHLHFRYMPTYAPPEERFLVVTGVSHNSVMVHVPAVFTFGQWISTVITFVINVWLIALIAHYGSNNGKEKHENGDGDHD